MSTHPSQLYGQKDLAEFCEYVIAALFQVPTLSTASQSHHGPIYGREGIDTPPYTPPNGDSASPSSSKRPEPPLLIEFIAYALYRTRLPLSIVHQSLLLLSRLKQRYPSARGTSSSPHRLFLSSLMLSAKISMDDTYSNKSWAIVGSNYFALKEVNQMERELFAFLGWNVVVQKDELDDFVAGAEHSWDAFRFGIQQEASSSSSSSSGTSSPVTESHKRRRVEERAAKETRHQQAKNAARALLRPHTYRHSSPSPVRSITASSSASSSVAASPAASLTSSPRHGFGKMRIDGGSSAQHTPISSASSSRRTSPMAGSSTDSSTFPSASHSPVSPESAPLSAGPQTPEHSDAHPMPHIHQHHHSSHYPDFPEAATYVAPKGVKHRGISPASAARVAA